MKRYLAVLLVAFLVAACWPLSLGPTGSRSALALGALMPTSEPAFTVRVDVNGTPLANGTPDVVGTEAMRTVTPALPTEVFGTQTAMAGASATPTATAGSTPALCTLMPTGSLPAGTYSVEVVMRDAATNLVPLPGIVFSSEVFCTVR